MSKKWEMCCESQPTVDPDTGRCQNGCGYKLLPSPVPQNPCGCLVKGFNDKIGWHIEIAYCKLHASASEMLQTLKNVLRDLDDEIKSLGQIPTDDEVIRNLIATLEEKK